MKKLVNIDYNELMSYTQTINELRNQVEKYQIEIVKLKKEIDILKNTGENILVIVKYKDKPDVYEYMSTEKKLLSDLVIENSKIRERYDELFSKIETLQNQIHLITLKYNEMENNYKHKIFVLEKYIKYLENRKLLDRIINKRNRF